MILLCLCLYKWAGARSSKRETTKPIVTNSKDIERACEGQFQVLFRSKCDRYKKLFYNIQQAPSYPTTYPFRHAILSCNEPHRQDAAEQTSKALLATQQVWSRLHSHSFIHNLLASRSLRSSSSDQTAIAQKGCPCSFLYIPGFSVPCSSPERKYKRKSSHHLSAVNMTHDRVI